MVLPLLLAFAALADEDVAVVNLRQPLVTMFPLHRKNVSATVVMRRGDLVNELASAACKHFATFGDACAEGDLEQVAEIMRNATPARSDQLGQEVMRQVRFGWDLLQVHGYFHEAQLQFSHALAAFPKSVFLLQELASASVLRTVKARDNALFIWGPNGTWAFREQPTPEDFKEALEGWESYASVRFKSPRRSLDEEEAELLAAGMPASGFVPNPEIDPSDSTTTLVAATLEHRLQHDLELVELLVELGLVSRATAIAAANVYRNVLKSAPRGNCSESGEFTCAQARGGVLYPTEDQWRALHPFLNRRMYVHPSPRTPGAALSPDLSSELIHSGGLMSSPLGGSLADGSVLVMEPLLSPEALRGLRDFAELSTIWFQERSSYLGAALSTGFTTPLLEQIAQELRMALPEILCDLPLANVWAFKFDDELQTGINVHSDQSAVNVNLWITPDDDNLDPATGGLVIFDGDDTGGVFGSRPNVTVPYRQNRAVVFDGARPHFTQTFAFRKGFRSRRINVTFLFGARGAYCPLRRELQFQMAEQKSASVAAA